MRSCYGLYLALILTVLLTSCVTDRSHTEQTANPSTHGNVQLTLKKGETMYGVKTAQDAPVEDAAIYDNAFNRIREGIFIRLGTQ